MKRNVVISAVSATVLVATVLVAACSSSKRASTQRASAQPASAQRASAQSAAVTGTIVVFAAASLKATFTTLAEKFEAANPGAKIVPSFGGSDTLAAQIVQGAPVDVFAAASTATMGTVTKAHDAEPPVNFAENALEIAVGPGNPKGITSLADATKSGVKLALCAPSVPCGAAASKALRAAGIAAQPVTLEQDVTSVLTKVELGEVDAGLVYQTDVKTAGAKVEGVNFPESGLALNTYPITVVTTGKNPTGAKAFMQFVLSAAGQQVLRAAGFGPAS